MQRLLSSRNDTDVLDANDSFITVPSKISIVPYSSLVTNNTKSVIGCNGVGKRTFTTKWVESGKHATKKHVDHNSITVADVSYLIDFHLLNPNNKNNTFDEINVKFNILNVLTFGRNYVNLMLIFSCSLSMMKNLSKKQ
jgi:ABC-type branched-subunit amino acid transport system ATPase component